MIGLRIHMSQIELKSRYYAGLNVTIKVETIKINEVEYMTY